MTADPAEDLDLEIVTDNGVSGILRGYSGSMKGVLQEYHGCLQAVSIEYTRSITGAYTEY